MAMDFLTSSFHGFRFAAPWFLLVLLLIPVWAWLRGLFGKVAAVEYSSIRLLREAAAKPRFTRTRIILLVRWLAVSLLTIALARPQVEKGLTDREAMGVNIMLVMDFSGTMKTKDFVVDNKRTSRAEAMKKVFAEFIKARENDRVGVVRFDAGAALISPLTLDHDWLLNQLAREEPTHGTNPGAGLLIGAEALMAAKDQAKVLILATDADNISDGPSPQDVAKAISTLGIRMHTIQIVDFKDMREDTAYGPLLQESAQFTGGQFFQVADGTGLRNVYRQIDQLEKTKFRENKQKTYRELMEWFALGGLATMIAELLLAHIVWRRLP